MTKSELISLLAARFPQLALKDVDVAVDALLRGLAKSLVDGKRAEIRGFGSFSLTLRGARQGRNPKSGEKMIVPAKCVPHFKPGKEMRMSVDAAAKHEATD